MFRSASEAFSKEMCQKVEDMILKDNCVKVSVIVRELGHFNWQSFQYHPFSLDDVKRSVPDGCHEC